MRASKSSRNVIEIRKSRRVGAFPQYILLGHRHLEKAPPDIAPEQEHVMVTIPVDLLTVPTFQVQDGQASYTLQVVDDDLINAIESIELHYRRK